MEKIVLDGLRARRNPVGLGTEEGLRNHDLVQGRERESQVDHDKVMRPDEHVAAGVCDISRYSMALKKFGDHGDELPH
jgi:hypothetical protein